MPLAALGLLLTIAAALVVPAPAQAQSGSGVLVVGDSLEEGTGPYLRRELRGVAPVTIDARRGRPSPEGVDVLRSRLQPGHSVVVFDLGVNNDPSLPQILAGDLETVAGLAGGRCLVVASLVRPPVGGTTIAAANGVIRSFATSRPHVQLVDWEAAAAQEPGLLSSDGVHATGGGYARRAQLVAEGVRGCLAGGPASGSTGIPAPRSNPRVPRRLPQVPEPAGPRPLAAGVAGLYGPLAGVVGREADLMLSALNGVRDVVAPRRAEPVLGAP